MPWDFPLFDVDGFGFAPYIPICVIYFLSAVEPPRSGSAFFIEDYFAGNFGKELSQAVSAAAVIKVRRPIFFASSCPLWIASYMRGLQTPFRAAISAGENEFRFTSASGGLLGLTPRTFGERNEKGNDFYLQHFAVFLHLKQNQ